RFLVLFLVVELFVQLKLPLEVVGGLDAVTTCPDHPLVVEGLEGFQVTAIDRPCDENTLLRSGRPAHYVQEVDQWTLDGRLQHRLPSIQDETHVPPLRAQFSPEFLRCHDRFMRRIYVKIDAHTSLQNRVPTISRTAHRLRLSERRPHSLLVDLVRAGEW